MTGWSRRGYSGDLGSAREVPAGRPLEAARASEDVHEGDPSYQEERMSERVDRGLGHPAAHRAVFARRAVFGLGLAALGWSRRKRA